MTIFLIFEDTESSKEVLNKEKEVFEAPVEFTIGDIVWAQARGLPSWPGKIVDERDVGHGKAAADIGKVNRSLQFHHRIAKSCREMIHVQYTESFEPCMTFRLVRL